MGQSSGLRVDFSAVRGRRLLVALSGGADSVALLHLLCQAREAMQTDLAAAHVDHGIRPESGEDAAFCREICAELNVPLQTERVDVPALARSTGEGVETAARRARYEALRRMRKQCGAELIALAHHLDDQAETVLMHLLRGCGPDGIGGMRALSGDLYRPLLGVTKAELVAYLNERGLSWREDATNALPFTPRNALRLYGLPALEESYPMAARAVARYAEAAQCENAYMRVQTDAFLRKSAETLPCGVRLNRPDEADEAILRRALRAICPEISHEGVLEIVRLCQSARGRTQLSGGMTVERTPGAVYFLPNAQSKPWVNAEIPLRVGRMTLPGLGELEVRSAKPEPVRDDPLRQTLRADALEGAVLRTRRNGDRMRPMGAGDRLLSDVLTDKRIDRPLRDIMPLAAKEGRVLWAVGACVSEEAKLRADGDAALELCWRPVMPKKLPIINK